MTYEGLDVRHLLWYCSKSINVSVAIPSIENIFVFFSYLNMKLSFICFFICFSCSASNESVIVPESISQAGIFGGNSAASNNAVQADQSVNHGIVFNEGWSPTLYT